MTDILVLLLVSIVSASLWYLVTVEYRAYHIDRTRLRLFKIRDELFDRAAIGEISFDVKAYGMTRMTVNGMINLTHEFALVRILLLGFVYVSQQASELIKAFEAKFEAAIAERPESEAAIVRDILKRAHLAILQHTLNTSLAILVLALPAILLVGTVKACRRAWLSFVNRLTSLNAWAAVDVEANLAMGKVHIA